MGLIQTKLEEMLLILFLTKRVRMRFIRNLQRVVQTSSSSDNTDSDKSNTTSSSSDNTDSDKSNDTKPTTKDDKKPDNSQ